MMPIVIIPGGLVGELGAAYLRQLVARDNAAPSSGKVAAWPLFLQARVDEKQPASRAIFQVIRGMCLQVYLYAMHRDYVVSGRHQPTVASAVRVGLASLSRSASHPHLLHFSCSCCLAGRPAAECVIGPRVSAYEAPA